MVGLAQTAHDNGSADAHAFCELPECCIDLDGKFARGAENEDFNCFAARNTGESLDNGDPERQSLAGAGLRRCDHIAAFHEGRNGLRLDGCWSDEFVLSEVVQQCGAA